VAKSSNATIGVLLLAGGAAYYLTRRDPITGRTVLDGPRPTTGGGTTAPPSYLVPGYTTVPTAGGGTTGAIISGGAAAAAAIIPTLIGTGAAAGTAAGTGAAAGAGAAGAGIGLAGALVITGIAAGAAILAWAIISKGLFRGGDEALHVSPARAEYLNQYNRALGLPDGSGQDDNALTLGFRTVGSTLFRSADGGGIPGFEVDRMLRRIHAADHVDEWKAAVADVEATWRAYDTLPATNSPAWRLRQLRGEVVFATGQTPAQLVTSALALGGGYDDLVTAYRRGF
jgi:hypothetical protein